VRLDPAAAASTRTRSDRSAHLSRLQPRRRGTWSPATVLSDAALSRLIWRTLGANCALCRLVPMMSPVTKANVRRSCLGADVVQRSQPLGAQGPRPLASTATRPHAGGVATVPAPGGVVSTRSTDQPLRHRRSRVSTRIPVRCDHPIRVSVSPFHVSTSTPLCGIAAGGRSSLDDLECGKSPDRWNRRRSGSLRRDRSVSRSSLRRNSSLGSGRWSRAGFRPGRRSSVTPEPPPPRCQVPGGRPARQVGEQYMPKMRYE
jgi:hypothetical protein